MTTKPIIFTSEDFEPYYPFDCKEAAEIANRKLESLLGPKVYTTIYPNEQLWTYGWAYHHNPRGDTHEGWLFGVRKIEKECVEHEPVFKAFKHSGYGIQIPDTPICKHCNKPLQAVWKTKE